MSEEQQELEIETAETPEPPAPKLSGHRIVLLRDAIVGGVPKGCHTLLATMTPTVDASPAAVLDACKNGVAGESDGTITAKRDSKIGDADVKKGDTVATVTLSEAPSFNYVVDANHNGLATIS